jgi:FxsC-like protein
MAYFFFSHAREDWDQYMKRFYDELVKEVEGRGKIPAAFRDQEDVEPGDAWPPAMSKALASCRTFVYVHSFRYFQSDYCGKEWSIFRDRVLRYAKAFGPPEDRPRLMLPILWYPPDPNIVPEVVAEVQYTHKDFGEIYSEEGLKQLIRLRSRHRTAYYDFLKNFTDKLLEVGAKWPLREEPNIASIKAVDSAWLTKPPLAASASRSAMPIRPLHRIPPGPGHALFYYIAGPPSEYVGYRTEMRGYGQVGGPDWSPYYPPPPEEKVASIVQKAVNDMNVVCYHSAVEDSLADRIEEAQRNNNVVVIVIDPWSLQLERYRKILEACDGRDFFNCAVLMAWNKNDADSNREIEQLKSKIQNEVLKTKFANRASNYYWEPIGSREELMSTLIQAVSGAHSKISKFLPVEPAEVDPMARTSSFPKQPSI